MSHSEVAIENNENSHPTPKTIYLKDYTPPDYWVDAVDLIFDLYDDHTLVHSTLTCRRNTETADKSTPLVLNGKNVKLKKIALNNKALDPKAYQLNELNDTLVLPEVPAQFILQMTTEIHPESNTELSGLYRSNDLFCTQCEAQGFRRMTYFPDRPDVMAKFTTTIYADKRRYPVLLSNGNCIAMGDEGETRHWAKWEDPFKKPCYLFALVAGNLVALEDHYITQTNRLITLKIYVEIENQDKCAHAMHALKQAMKWDEETYGREYDLDTYMIVAVNDFNAGAMENKGLNIFNSSCILARPETATDGNFSYIEAVVGHEYFHNWSGNRVTCRDWFQLSLKEGLTVFREQHFTHDISASTVSQIENAAYLRTSQFSEDAGPLAHAVRPESYVEINNFYTTTIYEKGAAVIRMQQTLLGSEIFRKGMDLYFTRYDGQAVTTDDFVSAMEEVSKRDLSQFKLWYSQAGTPEITVTEHYDDKTKIYALTLEQYCPPTPNQPTKLPMHIPVAVGLLSKTGKDLLLKTEVLELRQAKQHFQFKDIAEPPVLSVLRNFSAPVKIKTSQSDETLAFLLANDSDDFNRWDAGQKLSERFIFRLVNDYQQKKPLKMDPLWLEAHQAILNDKNIDLALKTEILSLPALTYLINQSEIAHIDALYAAKKFILQEMAKAWKEELRKYYEENLILGPYQYSTPLAAKRGFKNFCLGLLMELEEPQTIALCVKQWQTANNLTDSMGALYALLDTACPERQQMLQDFYEGGKHDPLLVTKWLRAHAMSDLENTLDEVQEIMQHPAFDLKNPNKVYALIGGFSSNLHRFHNKSGKAYRFLADIILKLDKMNPQLASRMMDAFTLWKKFDEPHKEKMQAELRRIQAEPKLSKDIYEKVNKCLDG